MEGSTISPAILRLSATPYPHVTTRWEKHASRSHTPRF
jgi:hypothetical protein